MIWFLISHDRGPKEPAGALWIAFGFGFIGYLLALFLEYIFIKVDIVSTENLGLALGATLGVGFIEEFSKFVPLSFYIYKKRYFNEFTDGIIYFALAGLSFGMIENFAYTLEYGVKVGVARMIIVPFFHASTTAIIGYFLAKKKVENKNYAQIGLVFALVALIHAIYNFGLASGIFYLVVFSLLLTALLTLGLFLYFMRANEKDRNMGISAIGKNKYCRHCGRLNNNKTLYCEYCGNKT